MCGRELRVREIDDREFFITQTVKNFLFGSNKLIAGTTGKRILSLHPKHQKKAAANHGQGFPYSVVAWRCTRFRNYIHSAVLEIYGTRPVQSLGKVPFAEGL